MTDQELIRELIQVVAHYAGQHIGKYGTSLADLALQASLQLLKEEGKGAASGN